MNPKTPTLVWQMYDKDKEIEASGGRKRIVDGLVVGNNIAD
jgi:hypothetical protein